MRDIDRAAGPTGWETAWCDRRTPDGFEQRGRGVAEGRSLTQAGCSATTRL